MPKIWKLSPGPEAKFWDQFVDAGCIAVGWLTSTRYDLSTISGPTEMEQRLAAEFRLAPERFSETTSETDIKRMAVNAYRESSIFAGRKDIEGMSVGDIVVANKGLNRVLGIGQITSDYMPPDYPTNPLQNQEYAQARNVDWVWKSSQGIEINGLFAQTTLYELNTDRVERILANPVLASELQNLMDIVEGPIRYWWVNLSGAYNQQRDGGYVWAPQLNSQGRKNEHWTNVSRLQPGDVIFSCAKGELRAIGRVTTPGEESNRPPEFPDSTWSEKGYRAKVDFVEPSKRLRVKEIPIAFRIATHGPFDKNGDLKQLYLMPISQEFAVFLNDQIGSGVPDPPRGPIINGKGSNRMEELRSIILLDESQIEDLERLITNPPRQVILEGPPGVGKSWVAKLFGRYLTDNPLGDPPPPLTNDRFEVVQFHQSYGYEDFIQGIRPETNQSGGITYTIKDGVFKSICDRARANPNLKYVLMIDEINRGNVSRIFGELLYLLEYRDEEIHLMHSRSAWDESPIAERFSIPKNVHLLGTMNSADRSLTTLDYALRRRFNFFKLTSISGERAPVLERWLDRRNVPQRDRIVSLFLDLNNKIIDEIGEDYEIGHSYFMKTNIGEVGVMDQIWKYNIKSLLEEYLQNNRNPSGVLDQFQQLFNR